MDNSKPVGTPVEIGTKLVKAKDGDNLVDQELYKSAVGSLLYLSTKTRPDIAYAAGNVTRFSSKPTQTHWFTDLCSFIKSRSRIHHFGRSSSGIDMVTATSNGYERKLCGTNDHF